MMNGRSWPDERTIRSAGEAGKVMVGDDRVPAARRERRLQAAGVLDADGVGREPLLAQRTQQQFVIELGVLDDQQPDRRVAGVRPVDPLGGIGRMHPVLSAVGRSSSTGQSGSVWSRPSRW
jgi:hypothetical protein